MRITATGHAGVFVDTAAGGVLCDPWQSPAYFASWFPFPDNSDVDFAAFKPDFLYISHLHRDHFDPKLLARSVAKSTTVLLPDFPTDELRTALTDIGFRSFVQTRNGEPLELDGLRVMITAMVSPTDGPIGDSALSLDDGETRLLNQNDARPPDPEQLDGLRRLRRPPPPVLRRHLVAGRVRAARGEQGRIRANASGSTGWSGPGDSSTRSVLVTCSRRVDRRVSSTRTCSSTTTSPTARTTSSRTSRVFLGYHGRSGVDQRPAAHPRKRRRSSQPAGCTVTHASRKTKSKSIFSEKNDPISRPTRHASAEPSRTSTSPGRAMTATCSRR